MSLLTPDKCFSSVVAIDTEWDLLRLGLNTVLLDIDNTIRRRDNAQVPPDVRAWLANTRNKGIKLCLLSNNIHEATYSFAKSLDLPVIARAAKPLPFSYYRAMKLMDSAREECVMVGDQIFTDIAGAHLAGILGYKVAPLVEADLPHTLVLRNFERKIVANCQEAPSTANVVENR